MPPLSRTPVGKDRNTTPSGYSPAPSSSHGVHGRVTHGSGKPRGRPGAGEGEKAAGAQWPSDSTRAVLLHEAPREQNPRPLLGLMELLPPEWPPSSPHGRVWARQSHGATAGAGQPSNDQDLSSQGPVEVRGGESAQVRWHLQACGSHTDKREGSWWPPTEPQADSPSGAMWTRTTVSRNGTRAPPLWDHGAWPCLSRKTSRGLFSLSCE